MTIKRDTRHGQSPTLTPLFGADKKPRPVDKDVFTLGRARGCDIALDANDVSALHCILYRAAIGFRVRDCGSRTGTRVNGGPVKNSHLNDGDVLQLGPFSFEIKLPAELASPPLAAPLVSPEDLERAQRRRRKLIQVALQLRRRARANAPSANGLGEKAANLKSKIRNYDQRVQQLEDTERELARERDSLTEEQETLRQHVQHVEKDLTRRRAETERDLKQKWDTFQQRCAAEERRLLEKVNASHAEAPAQDDGALEAQRTALDDQARRLAEAEHELKQKAEAFEQHCAAEERRLLEQANDGRTEASAQDVRELETQRAALDDQARRIAEAERELQQKAEAFEQHCAAEERRLLEQANDGRAEASAKDLHELETRRAALEDLEKKLQQRDHQVTQDYEEIERERQEIIKLKARCEAEQTLARTELEKQKTSAEQADAALRDQKAELTRMLNDLKRIQEELRRQPRVDHKALQQENQQLRQSVVQMEKRLAGSVDAQQVQAQLAEKEQARQQLVEELEALRRHLAGVEGAAQQTGDASALRRENEELRDLLQQHLLKGDPGSGDEELREENQRLRKLTADYEERFARGNGDGEDDDKLHAENELLRTLLQEKDKVLDEIRQMAPAEPTPEMRDLLQTQTSELERLRGEVAKYEKLAAEQAEQKPPVNGPPSHENMDLESYETELNRYRQQLEADRIKLNKEIDSLRLRNAELDEATRELEMELSRERAEMARERIRLDRLREEIKGEMERIQRDGGVRESLQGFQRLREEMKTTGGRR